MTPAADFERAIREASAAASAAIEAQRAASQAARRAELEQARAAECAEQGRLRSAIKEAERSVVDSGRSPVNDVCDSIDDVRGDGLPSKHGEQLPIGKTEPITSGAKAAGIEGTMHDGTKRDGGNGHEISFEGSSVVAPDYESRKRFNEMLRRWWDWVDSEFAYEQRAGEHYDLESLASRTCESAHATDRYFVETLIEATYFDDAERREFLSKPGRERALASWDRYIAARPALSAEELDALREHIRREYPEEKCDAGSHVQILEDRGQIFPGGDSQAFVRNYARTLPIGWGESIVVCLSPAEPVVICRWTDARVHISDTSKWAASLPWVNGQRRFVALERYTFGEAERVVVPPPRPARALTLTQLAAPPPVLAWSKPTTIHPTGIPALDREITTGGIATGSRIAIQAQTAQGKTSVCLEIAENWAARGLLVVWVATADDPRPAIVARRRQRLGMTERDALLSTDESMLDPRLFVVDGREHTLEDVLACRAQLDAVVIDPIVKVRTRNTSDDLIARVGQALDAVEQSALTTLMTTPVVRGSSRRVKTERAFGGSRIETGVNLLLELKRNGRDLTLEVVKARGLGMTEGQEIPLRLDRERQRVVSASDAVSGTEAIWTQVQNALVADGPRSARSLAEGAGKVPGRSTTIRAVIRERLASGELVEVDGKLGLPGT